MSETTRKQLISLIHAQKTQAGLSDDVYRTIIVANTGEDSCKELNVSQLFFVFNALNECLKKLDKPIFRFNRQKPDIRNAVVQRAESLLGTHWKTRLSGFLSRIGRKTVAECDDIDCRKIMGFLSTLERKEKQHG